MARRRPSPPLDAVGISTALLRPVVAALRAAGYACDEVDLPEAGGEETIDFLPGETADRLLDDAAVALADPAIGITIAERLPIGSLGMLDYALCMSATLREALLRVQRFYGYITQRARMDLAVVGAQATIVWPTVPGMRRSRHWIEFAPAILARRMRQTLPVELRLEAVTFAHPAPASDAAHRACFGLPAAFDAEADTLSFDAALLDLPLRTSSASFAALLDARMKEVTSATGADPFLAKVRAAVVRQLEAQQTSLAAAAAELRCKSRTLQRSLQTRGTSHARLLDEARRERAMRLLEEGQLSLAAVASDLGFSEPSAFFRAFRRWTGTSPTAARRRGQED